MAKEEFDGKQTSKAEVWTEVISRLAKSQNADFDEKDLKIIEVQAPDDNGQVRLHFAYGATRFLPITGDKRMTIETNVATVASRAVSSILSILETFPKK